MRVGWKPARKGRFSRNHLAQGIEVLEIATYSTVANGVGTTFGVVFPTLTGRPGATLLPGWKFGELLDPKDSPGWSGWVRGTGIWTSPEGDVIKIKIQRGDARSFGTLHLQLTPSPRRQTLWSAYGDQGSPDGFVQGETFSQVSTHVAGTQSWDLHVSETCRFRFSGPGSPSGSFSPEEGELLWEELKKSGAFPDNISDWLKDRRG
jgi:hypothetical protein